MKQWIRWLLLLSLALVPLAGIYVMKNASLVTELMVDTGGYAKGEALPFVKGKEVTGGMVDMEQYRGKPLVVMLAASDCGTCKSSYPLLQKWQETYPDVPLVMLGTGDEEEYARVKREMQFTFPILVLDQPLEETYRLKITPVFYHVNENGKIAGRLNGFTVKSFRSFMEGVQAP